MKFLKGFGFIILVFFIFIATSCKNENNESRVVCIKAYNEGDVSYGSAVAYNKEILITNAHILLADKDSKKLYDHIAYKDLNGNYIECKLLKIEVEEDLAQLGVTLDMNLYNISVKTEYEEVKTTVYAIGNFNNYGIATSSGIISGYIKMVYNNIENEFIQVDITVTNGNSGGGLFDERGRFIGIITFRTRDNSGTIIQGMAYAIPATRVIDFINEAK